MSRQLITKSFHNGDPYEAYRAGGCIELVFHPVTPRESSSTAQISEILRDPDSYLWTPFVEIVYLLDRGAAK